MVRDRGATLLGMVLGVLAVIVVAWLVIGLFGGFLRWVLSLIGYVVVAFAAFWIGRATAGVGSERQ